MADSDWTLIEATARGDHAAFECLVRRYQTPLFRFLYRTLGGEAGTAEDITQEVFLRAFRAAPRFEPRARVSTWLFRIAYNLAMSELKRRSRRPVSLEEAESLGAAKFVSTPADEPGASYELEEALSAALASLPLKQRAALLLRVHEELTYREIGAVMEISVESVESLIFRARRTLRKALDRKKR